MSRIEEIVEREVEKRGGYGPQESYEGVEMVPGGYWYSEDDLRAACLAVAKAVAEEAIEVLWIKPSGFCRVCGAQMETHPDYHASMCSTFKGLRALATPEAAGGEREGK